jgi:hypothetical protein
LLQSAARRGGHECSILDLNAHFLQPRTPKRTKHGVFIGDHDKPVGENSLNEIEKEFMSKYILPGIGREIGDDDDDGLQRRVKFGFLTHEEIQTAATAMVSSSFGAWARRVIAQQQQVIPDVVGISLLSYSCDRTFNDGQDALARLIGCMGRAAHFRIRREDAW